VQNVGVQWGKEFEGILAFAREKEVSCGLRLRFGLVLVLVAIRFGVVSGSIMERTAGKSLVGRRKHQGMSG
jgi:hypothetical protein